MANSKHRPRVSLSRVKFVISMMSGMGKSVAMIALLPDNTIQLHTRQSGAYLPSDSLELELANFIAANGED